MHRAIANGHCRTAAQGHLNPDSAPSVVAKTVGNFDATDQQKEAAVAALSALPTS